MQRLMLAGYDLRLNPPLYEWTFAIRMIAMFVLSNAYSLYDFNWTLAGHELPTLLQRISVALANNSAVGATLIWGYPWARDWVNDRVLELKALATSASMSPTASSKLNDTGKPAGPEDEERKEMTVGEYRALIRGASGLVLFLQHRGHHCSLYIRPFPEYGLALRFAPVPLYLARACPSYVPDVVGVELRGLDIRLGECLDGR
ncbi:hypothetical protein C8F01DRAFT_504376 [Mycena amicta]|nr:hypothetical protein C8F01DRAFT_504376 [Mycena amicta]